jgi:diguanylate cyclase (GGDEF)-like protein
MLDTKLDDEAGRLSALHRYQILDTPAAAPFDKITSLVKMLFEAPIAVVSLVDANRQWFKSRQGIDACQTPRDISFCTHTISSREPMLIEDALLDSRFCENPLVLGAPHIRSYAGIPLRTPDGYNIGSLCVIDTVPRVFDPGQVEILRSFAPLIIDEFELRQIAESDQLTGALSRRAFVAEADKAIARFQRHRRPSSLIMLDVDRFKSVNDSWGHPVGDQVLRTVAESCMAAMREGDYFGRIGGEEFAILQIEADLDQSMLAAERLRAVIEAVVIAHEPPLRVTASFGVAQLTEAHRSCAQWLAEADLGLYAAKRGGRNRVCTGQEHFVAA